LEQRGLKEEEIDVISKRTVEIISLLHRERGSWMKHFDVYLEVVECFLRKPNHIKRVPTGILVNYKNILIFLVKNCGKFTMEVRVSVVKSLGTLNNVEALKDLGDSGYTGRCPKCGRRNYMGLLVMMLVGGAVSNPCLVGEALHSIAEILKNECHEVDVGVASF
jgi:hypothetical protein